MGNIDSNMAGTPDPKDTGDAVVPETNGNPDETTVFQPVGLVEDAGEGGEPNGKTVRSGWSRPSPGSRRHRPRHRRIRLRAEQRERGRAGGSPVMRSWLEGGTA